MPETFDQLQAQRAFVYDWAYCTAVLDEEREEWASWLAQIALENFNRSVVH